jgi:hypothetical protein
MPKPTPLTDDQIAEAILVESHRIVAEVIELLLVREAIATLRLRHAIKP